MYEHWTENELNILKRVELTDKEVADILDRNLEAVKKKRQRVGIVKVRGRKNPAKGTFRD